MKLQKIDIAAGVLVLIAIVLWRRSKTEEKKNFSGYWVDRKAAALLNPMVSGRMMNPL